MYYAGIDPGKSGAIAIMEDTKIILLHKFDKVVYLDAISFLSKAQEKTKCAIEKVSSMPGQGVKSMFTFGENFGWIKGILDMGEISFQEIPPQKWKKEFSLTKDKQRSIEVSRQLFPDIQLIPKGCRVPDNNLAEAAMLCEFARRKL